MKPPIQLRPATALDREYLIRSTERLADFDVPAWRTRSEIALADRRILLEALDRPTPETMILIALDEAVPLGCVFASTETDYFTSEPIAHIEVVVVEASAEGRGIGRGLLDAAETWARGRGYRQIKLHVFESNRRARALYERAGYQAEIVKYFKRL
jgi:GNAT superfamily N-acetyltransferase